MALVSVLLLLLAATALAHGALLLARAELVASAGRVRLAATEAATSLALEEARLGPFDPELLDLPLWGGRVLDPAAGLGGVVRVLRLGPESWWLEHAVDSAAPRRTGSPGRLLWWMDPMERLRALGSVLSVGHGAEWSVTGVVDRTGFSHVPAPLDRSMCGLGSGDVDFFPDAVRALPDGPDPSSLGLLALDTLLARAPSAVEGTGTPAPEEALGACRADPWNWGEPTRPGSPCGGLVAVRAALGGLRVEGGEGQVALVVDGDLELAGDATIYGFVLATGALAVLGASELHGVAVGLGGVTVESGARVVGSACWAARALRAARSVWMPVPMPVPGLPPVAP